MTAKRHSSPASPDVTTGRDLATLTRAVQRAARMRQAGAIMVILAALCACFLWTPLDTRQLADDTGYSRDTVNRVVRKLWRAGALQLRPAPHGHRREVRLTPTNAPFLGQPGE